MMKKALYFSVVATLAALPLMTLAATVKPAQELVYGTTIMQDVGTVQAEAGNPDDLKANLSAAAIQKGATAYTIISVSGDDGWMYGTAIVYK